MGKRITLVVLTILCLEGCNDEALMTTFDDVVDSYSCKLGAEVNELLSTEAKQQLGNEEGNACKESYKNHPELRLLRAHLIAAAMARYGAARVEDYSEEKSIDATRLQMRIQNVVKELKEAVGGYLQGVC